jgi:hypothetical protein
MSANEMICRLFQARTAAHMAHLQTRSYAQHKALDDFYNEIVGLADAFAETYQGIFGLIDEYPPCPLPTGPAVAWIEQLRNWLKKNREACCQGETALENIQDEIQALCASTVYKLRFLDSGSEPEQKGEYTAMMKW